MDAVHMKLKHEVDIRLEAFDQDVKQPKAKEPGP